MDPKTCNPTEKKLARTNELIHPSIRYRIQQKGPGLAKADTDPGQRLYSPNALAAWTFCTPNEPRRDDKRLGIEDDAERWDEYGKWIVRGKDGVTTVVVEKRIEKGGEELELLDSWPVVSEKVLDG